MAGRIVDYLQGMKWDAGGPDPSTTTSTVSYYADGSRVSGVEGAGRWFGAGVAGLTFEGTVDPTVLEALLNGAHPGTGQLLLDGKGMAARGRTGPKDPAATVASSGDPGEVLSVDQTAILTGLSYKRVRELLGDHGKWQAAVAVFPVTHAAWVAEREAAHRAGREFTLSEPVAPERPNLCLVGEKVAGAWTVLRSEVDRFIGSHRPKETVVAYDVTFSAPKSVSMSWALANPDQRLVIEEAIWGSARAGIGYLEANGLSVAVTGPDGRGRAQTHGLIGAGYLHATNRNAEPQLHVHVVVTKIVERPDESLASLDASGMFGHAKTAGCLAAADLRHRLTSELGVEWAKVRNGVSEMVGWDRSVLRRWSSRTAQIDSVATELGLAGPAARQNIAYRTRAAKDLTTDPAVLRAAWAAALADDGLDGEWLDREVFGRHRSRHGDGIEVSAQDVRRLFRDLSGAHGVTELSASFDRRDVLQRIAEWANSRVSLEGIEDLTDTYLTRPDVTALNSPSAGAVIVRGDGRTVAISDALTLPRFTTIGMQAIEANLGVLYEAGRNRGVGQVARSSVETHIAASTQRGVTLGADQANMVRAITTSGHGVQLVVGPAGSGKTTALAVAARAWEEAGYRVLGTSVNGNAAETLAREAGIDAKTLESRLTWLDLADRPVLTGRDVIIVDEASTIGTRDLERLLRHASAAGAAVRLVGDPAQHTAVEAGGGFRALIDAHRARGDVVELTENRRQRGPDMETVRQALVTYRAGHVKTAWETLAADGRVTVSGDPGRLLDRLVCDWFDDRAAHLAAPESVKRSSMMAESHITREALNTRARVLLRDDGTLTGPEVAVGEQPFAVGDEVICRHATRLQSSENPKLKVNNGTRGVVVGFGGGEKRPSMIVEFEGGRGRIGVPNALLTKDLRAGVIGVITHSYALTTHAAQGETFQTARTLATERVSKEGLYVGLSRGVDTVIAYVPDEDAMLTELGHQRGEEPFLPVASGAQRDLIDTVGNRIAGQRSEQLSTEEDPNAGPARILANRNRLPELDTNAANYRGDPLAQAAVRERERLITEHAITNPDTALVETIGPRPPGAPGQDWDRAVGAIAVHTERYGLVTDPARPWWPPGQPPESPAGARSWEQLNGLFAPVMARNIALHCPPGELRDTINAVRRAVPVHGDVARDYAGLLYRAVEYAATNALRHPADYVTNLIGPRPPSGQPLHDWAEIGGQIERWRHEHLGLAPTDGPATRTTNPIEAAIGSEPDHPVALIAWRSLVDELTNHPGTHLDGHEVGRPPASAVTQRRAGGFER